MFKDRVEAGRKLAEKLEKYKGDKKVIVLAVPRGGVVVGREVAEHLDCPLDICVTKKLGAPGQSELAIGAVGPDGVWVVDEKIAESTGADERYIKQESEVKTKEVERRMKEFRKGKKELKLEGKTVILVDDGIATGATMEAAAKWLRQKKAKKMVLAVPVAPPDSLEKLKNLFDEVVCLETPWSFFAVGQFYEIFGQTTDEEVVRILNKQISNQ
jgi:putative phosphoribosyl transferase